MANSILTLNQITVEDLDHYTVLKLLHEVIGKTNELVGSTNGVYEILTYLLNEGLSEEVVEVLKKWLEDGTLGDLINDVLLNEKVGKLDPSNSITLSRIYRELNTNIAGTGVFLQGATTTIDSNVVYALYDISTPETNIVELKEVNLSTGTVIRNKTLQLGHANSLTYDSKRKRIISATLKKFINNVETYVNELIIIDYQTLNVIDTVTIGNDTISAVAYNDETDELFVLVDPFKVVVVDPDSFAIKNEIALDVPNKIKTFTRQSMEIWNSNIYLCGYRHNYISVYNMTGNNIQNYYIPDFIDNYYPIGELEDISSMGNGSFAIFSTLNVRSNSYINMISEANVTKQVASGVPFGFTNAKGPKRIYVDINSNISNPDGTEERPFKQLYEAVFPVTNPLLSNAEIYVADGVYDWTYIGDLNVDIKGNSKDNTIINGIFINNGTVSISNVKFETSDNSDYTGLISCFDATVNLSSININSNPIGIYGTNGSEIYCSNIVELNNSNEVHTLYGVNRSYIQYQKTASNIVNSYIDNSSQLLPNLLLYNNAGNSYPNKITLPKWFKKNIDYNSIKFLDFYVGIKVTNNTPVTQMFRIFATNYTTFTINLSRVSGNKTYISTINFKGANVDGAIELTKSTAYTTIIDSTTGTITTNEMVDGSEGSILIYRIFATN